MRGWLDRFERWVAGISEGDPGALLIVALAIAGLIGVVALGLAMRAP